MFSRFQKPGAAGVAEAKPVEANKAAAPAPEITTARSPSSFS